MLGYKVLRVHNGKLHSAIMIDDAAGVIYHRTTFTFPKKNCGPLCVFTSIRAAETFTRDESFDGERIEIWEVEYKPSRRRKIWDKDGVAWTLSKLPEDSRLADFVMLKKRYENQNLISD